MVEKHIRNGACFYSLLLSKVEKFAPIRIRQLFPGSALNLKTHPEVCMGYLRPTRNINETLLELVCPHSCLTLSFPIHCAILSHKYKLCNSSIPTTFSKASSLLSAI
jgi:hypothetical protein